LAGVVGGIGVNRSNSGGFFYDNLLMVALCHLYGQENALVQPKPMPAYGFNAIYLLPVNLYGR